MNSEVSENLLYIAMFVTAFLVPAYLAKRIKHGEARFDENGKMIDDE